MNKKDIDILVQREYAKKPLKGTFLIWRKLRIIRNLLELLKSNFDKLRQLDEIKNMPKLIEINERYKALHKRGEELFDVATNNKFYYGNKKQD